MNSALMSQLQKCPAAVCSHFFLAFVAASSCLSPRALHPNNVVFLRVLGSTSSKPRLFPGVGEPSLAALEAPATGAFIQAPAEGRAKVAFIFLTMKDSELSPGWSPGPLFFLGPLFRGLGSVRLAAKRRTGAENARGILEDRFETGRKA